jgi:uncharacterized protein
MMLNFYRCLTLRRRAILVIVAVVAVVAFVVWLVSSALVVRGFTQRFKPPFPEPPPTVAGRLAESHRITTSDGQEIGAWFVRGQPDKAAVLLLHGINASRGQMLPVMELLAKAGHTVLAISFRAHGDSTGETSAFGWSAQHDVIAAVEFLQHACPGRPVFVVGRSMGAAAAVFAARQLGQQVAGYFIEQPYKDLRSAVWCRLQLRLPPGLDWLAYGGLRLWAPLFLPVDPAQISPYDCVTDIPESVPIVFAGGSADRHAPLVDVQAIVNRVQSHARLVVFDGASHEALPNRDPQFYRTTLFRFLDRQPNDSHRSAD